jgi:hypothetical protein
MYLLAHFRHASGGDGGRVRRKWGTNGVVSGRFRVIIGRWWGH